MTAITFPNNPNSNPGVGGQYTAENGLIYVWDGEKWESLGSNNANPNNFVQVVGDNMTGDLTLGNGTDDKITLDATDGSAEFKGDVTVGAATGGGSTTGLIFQAPGAISSTRQDGNNSCFAGYTLGNTTATSQIFADGSAEFAGAVVANQVYSGPSSTTAAGLQVYQPFNSNNVVCNILGDGSAEFAGTIKLGGPNQVTGANGIELNALGYAVYVVDNGTVPDFPVMSIYKGSTQTIRFESAGSAEFLGSITAGDYPSPAAHMSAAAFYANANPKTATQLNSGVSVYQDGSNNGGITLRNTAGVTNISMIGSRGEATFAGTVTAANVTFNLEPDNDANYVTTTDVDEEGNTVETRVYNGPTLDVKAVIQELQQRVADRDAVIADFAARITQLETDHATMMGNNNGGY